MTLARFAAILLVIAGLSSCTGIGAGSDSPAASEAEASCGSATLAVSFIQGTGTAEARVRNTGSASCRFSGLYPVSVRWWDVNGAGPQKATGELGPNAVYVQPYSLGATNGCPWGQVGDGGPSHLPILVENEPLLADATAQHLHEVQDCMTATALAAHVES